MKQFISILLVAISLLTSFGVLTACSRNKKIYTCAYCGYEMKGAYWDYIDGHYACRICSKALRD